MPDTSSRTKRIFLIDDHPAVRDGLSLLLAQKGLTVCGEAENRTQTLERLAEARPDLALVDLSLGREDGLDLLRELQAHGVTALVYSMHDDARHIEAAFAAGARGYVTKREMANVLLEAIRETLTGRRYFSPVAAQALAEKHVAGTPDINLERLSERETEIFRRTGAGDSAADIAAHLGISTSTVETYYARIIEKLELNGTRELRRLAIQQARPG